MQDSPTAEAIDAEERALALRRFDADDAWWLGCRLRQMAAERQAPLAIEVRRAGTLLFSTLLPGATQDNQGWVARKIALALRFERSSYAMNLTFQGKENLFERFGLDLRTHMAAGGAVPIRLAGTGVIGAVAVSGLPQEVDHRLVVDALAALKVQQESGA